VSATPEVSTNALATRARHAATRAEAAAWALQVRAWQQPPSGHDSLLVALHQTATHLRSAADGLDPPDLVTYMSTLQVRSAEVSTVAMLVGVTVAGLTLSGPTMAVVVAAHVTAVMALHAFYTRWAVRRGPRGIDSGESNLPVVVAQLTTEITALLGALRPELGSRRAKAQAPLQTAAEWTQLARQTAAPDPTTGP
jgi:hypothetical protein